MTTEGPNARAGFKPAPVVDIPARTKLSCILKGLIESRITNEAPNEQSQSDSKRGQECGSTFLYGQHQDCENQLPSQFHLNK
jgi:hypothetical protein